MPIDLSTKSALVYDRGLYTYLAQALGEKFGKVYYYVPDSSLYPKSPKSQIGFSLPEIERVYEDKSAGSPELWKKLDKVDAVFFFDCYDGGFQNFLRSKGYNVFGAGLSSRMELDKTQFLQTLKDLNLDCPVTYRAEGIDDLLQYLEGKSDKWLKTPYYRGDFETYHFTSMPRLLSWVDDLVSRIGRTRSQSIEILVQNSIPSEAEAGYDGFCINGVFTSNCLIGYEVKDKGLIAKIFPETPKVLDDINQAFFPIYKSLGYQGHYSTEIRITKSGKSYFIDPTCRAPSPPSELMCVQYTNYAEAVYLISQGKVPTITHKDPYGVEIILTSPWYNDHELCVEIPKDIQPYVKLKNHTKRGNCFYCIPNDNAGFFGAVISTGSSLKSCITQALDIIKEIGCDELEYNENMFDKAQESIEAGEKYGIKF